MKHWQALLFTLLLCILPTHTEAKQVADLHVLKWATPYIQAVVDQEIMAVSTEHQFQPTNRVKRKEAAQVIVNALGLSLDADISIKAQDINASHPQYEAFRKLIELGILDDATQVRPDAYVTRGQMAKMVARSFQIKVDNRNIASFIDVSETCWAKNYVESLADAGILHGKANQHFEPYAPLRKAQLAKVIVEAKKFKEQITRYEIAYDSLGERYIMTPQGNKQWIEQTIGLVNQYRQQYQLPYLVEDPQLSQLATIKVNDMIERQYFHHRSPYYGQAWDLATLYDYEFITLGENIARSLTSPKEVVKAWGASDTHRENMLSQSYTHTGVAMVQDDAGKYYWVQLFSRK